MAPRLILLITSLLAAVACTVAGGGGTDATRFGQLVDRLEPVQRQVRRVPAADMPKVVDPAVHLNVELKAFPDTRSGRAREAGLTGPGPAPARPRQTPS